MTVLSSTAAVTFDLRSQGKVKVHDKNRTACFGVSACCERREDPSAHLPPFSCLMLWYSGTKSDVGRPICNT